MEGSEGKEMQEGKKQRTGNRRLRIAAASAAPNPPPTLPQ
jgi:hypothetical protein